MVSQENYKIRGKGKRKCFELQITIIKKNNSGEDPQVNKTLPLQQYATD